MPKPRSLWIRMALLVVSVVLAAEPALSAANVKVRPLRERDAMQADLNVKRVDQLLLPAMRRAGIDCWVIMSREFNEDFVLQYIMDSKSESGHRNAFMFYDDGSPRLQRVVIGTHLPSKSRVFDRIESYQDEPGIKGPSLIPGLRKTIQAWNPKKIGINESRTIPFCDGLTVQMKKYLVDAIGPEYEKRLVSAEGMIVEFLDTRLPEELTYFKEACDITLMINEEALSNKATTPGKTTIADVREYIYNRLSELALETWFEPGISIIRPAGSESSGGTIIQPGDLIHTDFGIIYIGLSTDFQKTAYVLKPGEIGAPGSYQMALENSLRVQDAIFQSSKPGKIGFKVKDEADGLLKSWGIKGSIYSHSIGAGGHGIGAWIDPDWPDRYSVRTAFPLRLNSLMAIESSATTNIPEWDNRSYTLGTEEDAVMTDKGYQYIIPRQEKLYLIKGL